MPVRVSKTRTGETRYYDAKKGTRLSTKEAHRREKIASYARKRFRDEAGAFRPRKIAVVARARPTDPKGGRRRWEKRREGRGLPPYIIVTAVVEVSSEDEEEILRALNEAEPDMEHFSVAGSEEVEE